MSPPGVTMNLHSCLDCHWTGMAPDDVAIVFHECRPPLSHRRRRVHLPPVSRDTHDDLTEVGRALSAAAGGEDAWYIDDEETK